MTFITKYLPNHWYLYIIAFIVINVTLTLTVKLVAKCLDECNKDVSYRWITGVVKLSVESIYAVFSYLICYSLCKTILLIFFENSYYKNVPNVLVLVISFIICLFITIISWSPIWEWKYKVFNTRRLTIDEKLRIAPMLDDLCKRGRQVYGSKKFNLRPNLRIISTDELNAYAYGYNLIILTTEIMVKLNDQELKGIIAHELGHLYNADSVRFLINSGLSFFYKIAKSISDLIFEVLKKMTMIYLLTWPFLIIFGGISYFTNRIESLTNILNLSFTRHQEYLADNFAVTLGQQQNLLAALKLIDSSKYLGLLENLNQTHPTSEFRNEAIKYGYQNEKLSNN